MGKIKFPRRGRPRADEVEKATVAGGVDKAIRAVRGALELVQAYSSARNIPPEWIDRDRFARPMGMFKFDGGDVPKSYGHYAKKTVGKVWYWKAGGKVYLLFLVKRAWADFVPYGSGKYITKPKKPAGLLKVFVERFPELSERAKELSRRFLALKKLPVPEGAVLLDYDKTYNVAVVEANGKRYFLTKQGSFEVDERTVADVFTKLRKAAGRYILPKSPKNPEKELERAIAKYVACKLAGCF